MSTSLVCDFCGNKMSVCLGDLDCNCGAGFHLRYGHRKSFFDGLYSSEEWTEVDICSRCSCLIRGGDSPKHLGEKKP